MRTSNSEKVVAVIEARMGSTRLPGKVLKKVMGRPLLSFLVERLRGSIMLNDIVVATSVDPRDDLIADFCCREGILCHRGSENDVLGRVVEAAELEGAQIYVEISGDCPIIDPGVVDHLVNEYRRLGHDIVTNCIVRSYPAGMDCVVCSYDLLRLSNAEAKEPRHREHVMLYLLEQPQRFSIHNVVAPPEVTWPRLRLLVDYPEDFQVIQTILETLYPKNPRFVLQEAIELVRIRNLQSINGHVWPEKVFGHLPPQEMT